jgi:hypothetical protein
MKNNKKKEKHLYPFGRGGGASSNQVRLRIFFLASKIMKT